MSLSYAENAYQPTANYMEDMSYMATQEYVEFSHIKMDCFELFYPQFNPVTTVCFDEFTELLWAGNQSGHVTSFRPDKDMYMFSRYSSFQAHNMEEGNVRSLASIESGIVSATGSSLHCRDRRGLVRMTHRDEQLSEMNSLLYHQNFYIGCNALVSTFDLEAQKVTSSCEIETADNFLLRGHSNFLISGESSGSIQLRDRSTLKTVHTIDAHSGALCDFDVFNNYVISCGFAERSGQLATERFVKSWDVRMTARSLRPMQTLSQPQFVRFTPMFSNRLLVVYDSGQFHLLELESTTSDTIYMQIPSTTQCLCVGVSPSYHYLAFADQSGMVFPFCKSNVPDPFVNKARLDVDLPDPETQLPAISFNQEVLDFSWIPTYPSSDSNPASMWPPQYGNMEKPYHEKPVSDDVIRTGRPYHGSTVGSNVLVATVPNYKRNCLFSPPQKGKIRTPKQAKAKTQKEQKEELFIQKKYRKPEVDYSQNKPTAEEEAFRYFNKTPFAGLENLSPSAYCNATLQLLYFIEPLRCALISHICGKEFCLACELGFLFHMLDTQKGKTCQASNFFRSFRTMRKAQMMELILKDDTIAKADLNRLIQTWITFIMQQLLVDTSSSPELPDLSKLSVEDAKDSEKPEDSKEEVKEETEKEPEVVALEASEDDTATIEGEDPEKPTDEQDEEKPSEDEEEKEEVEKVEPPEEPLKVDTTTPIVEEASIAKVDAPPESPKFTSVIDELFAMKVRIEFACQSCNERSTRHDVAHVTELIYPPIDGDIVKPCTFSSVVQSSMCCEQVLQTWCNKCSKYTAHSMKKFVKSLPDILVLNCHLLSDQDIKFWSEQQKYLLRKFPKTTSEADLRELCRFGSRCNKASCKYKHREASPAGRFEETVKRTWIPPAIETRMKKSSEAFTVQELYPISKDGELPKPININPDDVVTQFECFGAIAHTGLKPNTNGHLVALADVGYTYHQRKEGVTCSQCYLFNDFLISPIEKWEILEFDMEWKRPSILFFTRKDLNKFHMIKIQNPLTTDLLFQNQSLVMPRNKLTFTPLELEELPGKGDLVGVDAEFVSLNQEETELKRDGSFSTVKPSHMSLARVTVIRGKDPSRGVPFIDDYIVAQEQVADYLTSVSGISPGDLNVKYSSKFLTPLKVTYSKLRVLVDRGVVFVGHGLQKAVACLGTIWDTRGTVPSQESAALRHLFAPAHPSLLLSFKHPTARQDFKVINIIVPLLQVIDTAELFRTHKRSRIASLKFLAWFFLKRDIQTGTHDSIEDALAALDLYKEYTYIHDENCEIHENERTIPWYKVYNEMKEAGELEAKLQELFDKGHALSWKVPPNGEQPAAAT